MPTDGRWDLIRRLKGEIKAIIMQQLKCVEETLITNCTVR
jgi:hypothetical protein